MVRKRWGSEMATAGDPDLTGCYRGLHFELEVKAPGGRLTRIQQVRLDEWRRAGALTGVVRSAGEARHILGITSGAPTFQDRAGIAPALETAESQREKLPARGAKKPNADEQAGDWGD
ncbi:MAG: VRR-NUC domain-containing protein [Bryobacterales bacterium]|nr:VRR-NUC domain-containing protein [Bryobacterales bacterium]